MRRITFLRPSQVRRELTKAQQNWLRRRVLALNLVSAQIDSIHESGSHLDPQVEKKFDEGVHEVIQYVNSQLVMKIRDDESWISVREQILKAYPDLIPKI